MTAEGEKVLTGEHGMEVRATGGQHHLVGWDLYAVSHEDHITQLTLPAQIKNRGNQIILNQIFN